MKTRIDAVLLALFLVALTPPASAPAQSSPEGESHFNSGLTHLREGRIDLAVSAFKRAVKTDPENPYFRKGLGQAYAAKRKWKDAIKQFKEALELNPYYVDVRNDLGTALILAGKREEGRAEFLTAYSDPTNPTPELSARNLGQAYLEEKNYTEAMDWFRTAISRSASYPDPYIDLAGALVTTDRLDEAVVLLETGAEKVPDHPGLLYSLGQAYFRVGRFVEARERLEEAMRRDPSGRIGQAAADLLAQMPS
jgi:Tfp pilus assembly protein PilF